jgi:hypothetical protein
MSSQKHGSDDMESNITQLADELHALSAKYRGGVAVVPAGLYRLSDLPERPADNGEAWEAMRRFGRGLAASNGNLMMEVYDAAVDRHGYEGVYGVSSAWHGIGGWAA